MNNKATGIGSEATLDRRQIDTETDADYHRSWMARILERLAPAEVSVPRRYSIYTLPDTQFPRECFSQACYYVQTHRIAGMHYVLGEAVCGGIQQHQTS